MTYVMEMSTNQDIIDTNLHSSWQPIQARYDWWQVRDTGLDINNPAVIVVAHGDGSHIGNAAPGTIDIDAEIFLTLIQGNMRAGHTPNAIYISTCGPGIAKFSARVRLLAEQNEIWHNTRIFGHADPVAGDVPPANDIRWFEIYSANAEAVAML